jgi:hypothetical protein
MAVHFGRDSWHVHGRPFSLLSFHGLFFANGAKKCLILKYPFQKVSLDWGFFVDFLKIQLCLMFWPIDGYTYRNLRLFLM